MLCERNGVHLADVETFPFFTAADAPDPDAASEALDEVSVHMGELAALPELEQGPRYGEVRPALDQAVFRYFGLRGGRADARARDGRRAHAVHSAAQLPQPRHTRTTRRQQRGLRRLCLRAR